MKIKLFLFFKVIVSLFLPLGACYSCIAIDKLPHQKNIPMPVTHASLAQLSGKFLLQIKMQKETQAIEKELFELNIDSLKAALADDNAKKVFWINIYNAYYQLLYTRDNKRKPAIFTKKLIPIAHTYFSLDDIEHGILRKYRSKYSLGYWGNIFTSSLIKHLAVDTIDYRIHFALNCGAKSCPPITFYQYEKIDEQLDKATRSFLLAETEVDETKKQIRTSKILSWFRGDFGGKKGIKNILGGLMNQNLNDYTLKFKVYDWEASMANFGE
ncbi:MAG: DUF547 domain-containing protein [Thermoflexibacter sp.]|jgi:hypothetical protein|nr:DUF547 domain-containing protein [Thermoflexibacter sp.]